MNVGIVVILFWIHSVKKNQFFPIFNFQSNINSKKNSDYKTIGVNQISEIHHFNMVHYLIMVK